MASGKSKGSRRYDKENILWQSTVAIRSDPVGSPLFAIARCVSWCAHRMEELVNKGPIIRPAYKPLYRLRDYVPLKDRK